jgi:glycosyltransferase involved in cell wall biosynthesis/ubiquinone/menaquinone biosynthesis C-methylase UbiE
MTYPDEISTDPEDIFNGEREIGTRIDEFPEDHVGRYLFARSLMNRQTRALDIGCGVGYGSHLLSKVAGHVTGLDYRPKVIDYARQNWGNANLTFEVANALDRTTYPNQKYDFATAFEIIEHLPDDGLFLNTIKEHLTEDGVLCVSAPNLQVLEHPEENPWHFRHYTPDTFRALLLQYFTNVALFDQPAGPVIPGSGSRTNVAVAYDNWPHKFSIAVVSQEYPAPKHTNYPISGGIGTYSHSLAQHLVQRGHEVHVFAKGLDDSQNQTYSEGSVSVHRLSQKASGRNFISRRFMLANGALRRMLAVRAALNVGPSFDLIEAAEWRAETLLSHTKKTRNAVWITRLHTPHFIVRKYSDTTTGLDDRIVDWFEKFNSQLADEITSPSRALAEICLEAWRLRPISDIPNPVDISDQTDIPEKDDLVIGYLPGRFDAYKGFPTVARALPEFLPDSGNRFRFILLGSDHVYDESKELLQSLSSWIDDGSAKRPITLLPRKTRDEIQDISKGLDAVLVTSRFENAPYVVLEALAAAKLVVAPRIGGLPELIDDGQTGFLFEPDSPSSLAQSLKHIATLDKTEIARIRSNGQRAAQQKFSLEALLPIFEVYYTHLIGQKVQGIRRKRPVGWWLPNHGPLLPAWWHTWRQRA